MITKPVTSSYFPVNDLGGQRTCPAGPVVGQSARRRAGVGQDRGCPRRDRWPGGWSCLARSFWRQRRCGWSRLTAGHAGPLAVAAAEDRASYRFTWVPDDLDDARSYVE